MAENKVSVHARATPKDRAEDALAPLVDIYEEKDGTTVLLAEVPGAAPKGLDIRVNKGVLTIEAQAPPAEPEGDFTRTYTGFVGGTYFRAFALSDEIDRENIVASLEDGLLKLRLPRAAQTKTRRIEIRDE